MHAEHGLVKPCSYWAMLMSGTYFQKGVHVGSDITENLIGNLIGTKRSQ